VLRYAPFFASRPKVPGLLEYGASVEKLWFLNRAIFMPWDLPELIGSERTEDALSRLRLVDILQNSVRPDPVSDPARVASLEASLYMRNQLLRDADWAGMAHSLEIRLPMVDVELLGQLAPLFHQAWQSGEGKARAAAAPSRPLPAEVLNRRKTGFTVPIAEWASRARWSDSWRSVRMLNHEHCPWARRWAYAVAEDFGLLAS
jgi:asparagine synthase (glutamine-hydrolysing)